MYKSLIEVERKRLASTTGSNDAPLSHNEVPRGYFVRNRNLAALSPATFASADGKFLIKLLAEWNVISI